VGGHHPGARAGLHLPTSPLEQPILTSHSRNDVTQD
jgi:hypothetical protein